MKYGHAYLIEKLFYFSHYKISYPVIQFQFSMQWAKFNLEKKIHGVLVNVSENFALLSRDKIGIKEDLTT